MERNSSSNTSEFSENPWLSYQDPEREPVMIASKIIVGSIGVVGNLLVVIVFVKHKKLFQNISTTFIVNQSVIDSIVSLLLILTTFVERQLPGDVDGVWIGLYCKLWVSQLPLWALMTSSTCNLMAISTERYLAIVHPMWNRVYFTKIKADIVAVFIWIFGVSFVASIVIPTTSVMGGGCFTSRETGWVVPSAHVFVDVINPIIVHCFCYIRIFSVLHKRKEMVTTPADCANATTQRENTGETNATSTTRGVDNHVDEYNMACSSVSLQSTSNLSLNAPTDDASLSSDRRLYSLEIQNERAKRNVVKTLAIVTACYFLCWMPNKIYIILYLTGIVHTFTRVYAFTVILAFINGCINPMIYIGKCNAFKTGLSMLCRPLR